MTEVKDLHFIGVVILLTLYLFGFTSEAVQCIAW